MKRARDRWNLHLMLGVLAVSFTLFIQAESLKATSLFKTTTTTTTTTTSTEAPKAEEGEDEFGLSTTPASNLTGIPQIDYVHDPNLPRELNGYNLSGYPFLSSVPPPEQMDFKCDGLHDGFYASVPLKCQVYHQCLYGFRYDFLCANYTAFDQSTFICHFVSEVDCVNSKKFWHRNDALYKATTSSTPATTTTTSTTTTAPPPTRPRPAHRRRPGRRRRPQYDFYDDDYYAPADDEEYYEDDRRPYNEGRSNGRGRKRPRPFQRRPAFDEYEDDRYDRRQEGRPRDKDEDNRRPYDRPRKPTRRPSAERERQDDRKPYTDDDRSFDRNRKNKPSDEKRSNSDDYDRRPFDDDRRSYDRPRRPFRDDDRPARDESPKDEPYSKDERFRDDKPSRERPYRDEKPQREQNERRPYRDDPAYDDDDKLYSDYKGSKRSENVETTTTSSTLVKPAGGSLFSKPRIPPKIARPVPISEKEKYKYVPSSSSKASGAKPVSDEEYYDDYELEDPKAGPPPPPPPPKSRARPDNSDKDRFKSAVDRPRSVPENDAPKRPQPTNNFQQKRPASQDSKRSQFSDEASYDDFEEPRAKRPTPLRAKETEPRQSSRRGPPKVEEEYYYDDEEPLKMKETRESNPRTRGSSKYEANDNERLPIKTEKETISTTSSYKSSLQRNNPSEIATTAAIPIEATSKESDKGDKSDQKPFVRVVKRPFLPSRGGSPYLPRGLQPLGGKNFNKTSTTTTTTSTTTENIVQPDYSYETDYDIKDNKATFYKSGSSEEIVEREPDPVDLQQKTREFKDSQKQSPFKGIEDRRQSYLNAQKIEKDSKEFLSTAPELNSGSFQSDKIKTYEQNVRNTPKPGSVQQNRYNSDYVKSPDRLQTFKPSPQISDPYKPTNRPFLHKIPENISIKQNLADSIESDYDVTLNDALNPTISNLPPIRNFPSPFIVPADRDYSFARFRNGYSEAGTTGFSNYQTRTPNHGGKFENSQRYVGHGYSKNDQIGDSLASASDRVNPQVVSIRTPQSFFIQQPRYSSSFSADETNSGLRSHVTYRQVDLGDYA